MKWALIGASDIAATQVLPAMRASGHEAVGAMSADPERGARYAADHGLERSTTALDDIANWGVDAVYISTTNELHAGQAVWAANAGLHVLSEKPLAMTVDEATAMIQAARANGVVLATNHHLRASRALAVARGMLASGELGDLRGLRLNFAGSLPERLRGWRITNRTAGAGVVLDLTVHNADTVRFLTGDEITAVTAVTRTLEMGEGGIEDSAFCIFELSGGTAATTYESFSAPESVNTVEIHGSKGSLYLRDVLTQEQNGTAALRRGGVETAVPVEQITNVYVSTLEAFASAVAGTGVPLCTGEDGRASLTVALAALQSAAEGRRVEI